MPAASPRLLKLKLTQNPWPCREQVEHRAEQTSRLSDVRPEPVPEAAVDGDHWLIVVDRHETALYHTLTKARGGDVPQQRCVRPLSGHELFADGHLLHRRAARTQGTIPSQLRPYDPVGIRHKLKHKKARPGKNPPTLKRTTRCDSSSIRPLPQPQGQYPVYHGDSVPEDPAYYKAIASELREAKQARRARGDAAAWVGGERTSDSPSVPAARSGNSGGPRHWEGERHVPARGRAAAAPP